MDTTSSVRPYVSIDIETTGLDWTVCQTIEIGAVIDDWVSPVDELPTFNCYIHHKIFRGQPHALSMHAGIFRAIATGDTDVPIFKPDKVADEFCWWLGSNDLYPETENLVVAGKNFAAFDRNFLDLLPHWANNVRMKHRFIDPGSLYYRPGIDDVPPDTEECLRRAGLTPHVSHKALVDAFDIVHLIRARREDA